MTLWGPWHLSSKTELLGIQKSSGFTPEVVQTQADSSPWAALFPEVSEGSPPLCVCSVLRDVRRSRRSTRNLRGVIWTLHMWPLCTSH